MSFETLEFLDKYEQARKGSIQYREYVDLVGCVPRWKPRPERVWNSLAAASEVKIVGARAIDGGELVGIGMLTRYGARGWLTNLVVRPEHRGQGIGQAIVDTRVQIADELGMETLVTRLMRTNKLRGHYEELGFRLAENGQHVRQLGDI